MKTAVPDQAGSKGARTRARILDAAARVLRRQGYATTTLGDIAAEADLKTGSLYFHFAAKEDLVREMLIHGITVTMEQIRDAVSVLGPESAPEVRIRVAVEAHLSGLHTQNDYAAAVLRTVDQFPEAARAGVRDAQRSYLRFWQRLIAEAQRGGRIDERLDSALLAALLLGAMNSTWGADVPRRPSRRLTETLLAMVGLAPQHR